MKTNERDDDSPTLQNHNHNQCNAAHNHSALLPTCPDTTNQYPQGIPWTTFIILCSLATSKSKSANGPTMNDREKWIANFHEQSTHNQSSMTRTSLEIHRIVKARVKLVTTVQADEKFHIHHQTL